MLGRRRGRRRTRAAALAALALVALATGCIKDLGTPGYYGSTTVADVAPNGAIVGTSFDFSSSGLTNLGYIYEAGAYSPIGQPVPNGGTGAAAVNSSGTVAGCRFADSSVEPFVWTRAGGIQPISVGPATNGMCAWGMNEAGEVIVHNFSQPDQGTSWVWRPSGAPVELLPPDGTTYTEAHDINDAGQVVGTAFGSNGHYAPVLWEPPLYEPQVLPTPAGADASADLVDQDGTVVGHVEGAADYTRWAPTAGRPSTTFSGISPTDMDGGVIVGIVRDDSGVDHAAALMPGAAAPKRLSDFGGSSSALAISGTIVVGQAYVPDAGSTHIARFSLP